MLILKQRSRCRVCDLMLILMQRSRCRVCDLMLILKQRSRCRVGDLMLILMQRSRGRWGSSEEPPRGGPWKVLAIPCKVPTNPHNCK